VSGTVLRVLAAGLNVVAAGLLTRILSPSDFGAYVLAYSVVLIASVAAAVGLENITMRRVALAHAEEQPGRLLATLTAAQRLVWIGSAVVAALLFLGRGTLFGELWKAPALVGMVGWLALWAVFQALNSVQAAALRGAHRIVWADALGTGAVRIAAFVAITLAFWLSGGLTLGETMLAAAASAALSYALGAYAISRHLRPLAAGMTNGETDAPAVTIPLLWAESWPLLATTLLSYIVAQADLWAVGAYTSPERAAVYGAVARLMFVTALPHTVATVAVASSIVELHARGERRAMERLLRGAATVAAIPTFLVLLMFAAVGGPMLRLLFGDYYAQGATVLVVLSFGQAINAWTGACGISLMVTGHQTRQLRIAAATVVMLVLGVAWAGPRYGMLGIAIVSASSIAANNVVTLLIVRRALGITTRATLSPWGAIRSIRELVRAGQRPPSSFPTS
jgi:O-antigen/teichoic acid export membrane protein